MKTLTIKIEKPNEDEKIIVIEYEGDVPTLEEWEQALDFQDAHVGGRPIGR